MKNLAKIFMAVVAGMFAFSCVTDTTEDLGIEVGKGGGKTQITLSLEESRTQLGEKADGLYPVYWSEGDAIAVNGAISTPLAAEAAGQPSATFQVNGDVAYPYCVVYPASAAVTVEEGGEATEPEPEPAPVTAYPVTFANVQPYTVGTFAPQSAPMYAYTVEAAEGEEQSPIQMQHLTGVLRLAVKGDITLASMTVAAEGKIAGLHTVDCTTGVLTADESATNNITVTLPEGGLKLNADVATPIYVAVPAGEHGIYTITLVSDALVDNTMVVRFNSDFHPVVAGVVKEFGEVTFTPNATSGEEGELVIVNAAQMKRLAQLSEVGQLSNVTKVTVGATIDMSDVAWTGINILPSHIVFDGGADQGYEIKGLKAPLFGATAATVKNVKLTDVAIVETEDVIVGAIARRFHGTMTNCSAVGTLEMNNTTYTTTASMENFDVINIGGLVGQAGNATFENCENRVAVTVKSVCGEDTTPYIAVGGAVGGAHSKSSFTNIDNYGTITIAKSVYSNHTYVGGVLGAMTTKTSLPAPAVTTITGCNNHGKISTDVSDGAAEEGATQITLGFLKMGGICANMAANMTDFSNNHNHAAIQHKGWAGETGMAGIIATQNYSAVVNCTNNAPITNSGRVSFLQIGGIVGDDGLAAITNCTNNEAGDLTQEATLDTGMGASANVYIGGVVAGNEAAQETIEGLDPAANAISGCYNKGDITLSGYVNSVFLGGINARECGLNINNCHNSGNIKHIGTHRSNFYIAGISGLNAPSIVGSTNSGDITICGTAEDPLILDNQCIITGISGTVSGVLKNCSNSGDITVDYINHTHKDNNTNVFGIVTTASCSTEKIYNCDNSGNISIAETGAITKAGGTVYVGGCLGTVSNQLVEGCDNTGNITIGSKSPLRTTYISGVAYKAAKGIYDCTNKGTITANGDTENTTTQVSLYVGGVVNLAYGYMAECENLTGGDITIQNYPKMTMQLGGVAEYTYATADSSSTNKWSNNKNHANININNVGGWLNDTHFRIGGIIAANTTSGTLTADNQVVLHNSANNGNITFQNLHPGVKSDNAFARPVIGGCIGTAMTGPYVLDNVDNNGTITVNTYGKDNTFVGGVIGYWSMAAGTADVYIKNCDNTKDITVTTTKPSTGAATGNKTEGILLGGIVGGSYKNAATGYDITVSDCSNSGNITLKGNYFSSGSSRYQVGGIIGDGYAYGAYTRCYNSGTITLDGGKQKLPTVEVAGLMARHYPHSSQTYKYGTHTDCVNQGKVVVKNINVNSSLYVAGILGNDSHQTNKVATYTNCANSGEIYIESVTVSTGKAFYVGGLTGRSNCTSLTYTGNNVNIGNIILKDCTSDNTTTFVGGINGVVSKPITNSKAYCGIMAPNYTNVGWIMGTNRTDGKLASGCGIGGKVITNITEIPKFDVDDNPDGFEISIEGTDITESNYLSKVYGGTTPAESDAEASLLTEAPTVTRPAVPAE